MKNIKKINKILFSVFVAAFMFYIIKEPKSSTDIVLKGLNLCYFVIIPVIFPFFAFSKMFIHSAFFVFLARIIFSISSSDTYFMLQAHNTIDIGCALR